MTCLCYPWDFQHLLIFSPPLLPTRKEEAEGMPSYKEGLNNGVYGYPYMEAVMLIDVWWRCPVHLLLSVSFVPHLQLAARHHQERLHDQHVHNNDLRFSRLKLFNQKPTSTSSFSLGPLQLERKHFAWIQSLKRVFVDLSLRGGYRHLPEKRLPETPQSLPDSPFGTTYCGFVACHQHRSMLLVRTGYFLFPKSSRRCVWFYSIFCSTHRVPTLQPLFSFSWWCH